MMMACSMPQGPQRMKSRSMAFGVRAMGRMFPSFGATPQPSTISDMSLSFSAGGPPMGISRQSDCVVMKLCSAEDVYPGSSGHSSKEKEPGLDFIEIHVSSIYNLQCPRLGGTLSKLKMEADLKIIKAT